MLIAFLAYPIPMAELTLAIFIAGVLLIADPERLQTILDRIHDLALWLAE